FRVSADHDGLSGIEVGSIQGWRPVDRAVDARSAAKPDGWRQTRRTQPKAERAGDPSGGGPRRGRRNWKRAVRFGRTQGCGRDPGESYGQGAAVGTGAGVEEAHRHRQFAEESDGEGGAESSRPFGEVACVKDCERSGANSHGEPGAIGEQRAGARSSRKSFSSGSHSRQGIEDRSALPSGAASENTDPSVKKRAGLQARPNHTRS